MNDGRESLIGRGSIVLSLAFALILASTAGVIAWPRLARTTGVASAPKPPEPAYRAGEQVDVPDAWYSGSPYTLVLFAQSTCGACQKAQPYLADLMSTVRPHATIVVASPGTNREAELLYVRSLGLPDATLVAVTRNLRAKVTPTLLVLNQAGVVLGAWEGVGPAEQHAALTRAILRVATGNDRSRQVTTGNDR